MELRAAREPVALQGSRRMSGRRRRQRRRKICLKEAPHSATVQNSAQNLQRFLYATSINSCLQNYRMLRNVTAVSSGRENGQS